MALFGLVGNATDITDMLQQDHRKVETLFAEFKNAGSPAARLRIARQAMQELTIHAEIEERIFYPAMRRQAKEAPARDMVGEAVEEHHVVKLLIRELQRARSADETFKHKFIVLSELVMHHAQEEEKEMFPAAESADLDLEALGREAAMRKQALQRGGGRRSSQRAARRSRGVRAARGGRRRNGVASGGQRRGARKK